MVKTRLVPLDEAIFKFTKEYIAPKPLINSEEELKKINEIEGAGWKFATAAMIAISAIGKPFIEQRRRFEILSKKIRNGRLMAYGLRTKPTTGTAPEQIPSYLFDNAVYLPLEKGIEKAGHRYELVQVSKAHSRKPKNQFADAVASPRGVGRPSKDEEIDAAIKSLIKSDFDFQKVL